MKTIFIVLLLVVSTCYSNCGSAKIYYFSSIYGVDSRPRPSTQAQNPSTPWKTLSKLKSFFGSLQPGYFVLFKRGETFNRSITVNKSGISSEPFVISNYCTGHKPVITSLVTPSCREANPTYSIVNESDAIQGRPITQSEY